MEHFQEAEHITMLRNTVRRFVENEMPRELAQRWDRENEYPRDVFEKLSALGVNALTVPEEYGGAGRDITATMVVIEELARRSMAVAVPFIMCSCYGGMNIEEVGSAEQKAELLPKLAEGKLLFAYGISEPDVGADVAGVRTTAERKGNGGTVTINGAKRFCSGANIADYIYTVVKSDREGERYKNLSIVLIPPDAPGVTIELQNAMGMKGASTCDVTFQDVEIPVENIVGGEDGWNDGWRRIVGPGLDVEKIEVAALALGNAAAAVDDAWQYAQERKQFGKPVSAFQSVRHMLVDAKTKLHACRLMTYHAAWLLDEKKPASIETSMAKLYVSDTAKEVVLSCQQVMGAYGYIKEFDMERYVREALLMPIIGGSSAIQKNNIANPPAAGTRVAAMQADVSGWKTRLTDALIAENTASGIWRNLTLADQLDDVMAENPDKVLFIEGGRSVTVAKMARQARALASALQLRGLVAGDVVSFELPNWPETVAIDLACAMLGLVCNPIIPIYRDAEVTYILRDAGTKAFFIPTTFRNFDYAEMVARHRTELPDLEHVITVRGQADGAETFEEILAEGFPNDFVRPKVDPNAVKLIMYTSGTTGRPKGVLHSHNTIDTEIQAISKFLSLDDSDVILMPSPVSHITGYLYGIQMPFTLNAPAVFMETWDAAGAAVLIDEHGVTFTIAATVFLQELTDFARRNARRLPSLRYFPSGGAPVPPEVIHNAHKAFARCVCSRVYGSTEAPTVTLGVNSRNEERLGATTEGYVVGHEVKIVNPATGKEVDTGIEGEILTRGPEMCLGYAADDHNAEAFDDEGYFYTGDLAMMTDDGAMVITGRSKDLIIRGGENISPREVEDALHEHPAIHEAAIVAMPHERLGETGCAYVVLEDGTALSFDEMVAFLKKTGMAKQKYPERLEIVDEFPRTAAGKIRKNVLRDRIAAALAGKH